MTDRQARQVEGEIETDDLRPGDVTGLVKDLVTNAVRVIGPYRLAGDALDTPPPMSASEAMWLVMS